MILYLLRMRRNVNRNVFNDRKNVSATTPLPPRRPKRHQATMTSSRDSWCLCLRGLAFHIRANATTIKATDFTGTDGKVYSSTRYVFLVD